MILRTNEGENSQHANVVEHDMKASNFFCRSGLQCLKICQALLHTIVHRG